MECFNCNKEINAKEVLLLILKCEHRFCNECQEIIKEKSEIIDDFMNVKCLKCDKKCDISIKQQEYMARYL